MGKDTLAGRAIKGFCQIFRWFLNKFRQNGIYIFALKLKFRQNDIKIKSLERKNAMARELQ